MIETADFAFRTLAFIPLLCFFSYCCGRRTVVGSRKVASHRNAFLCPALKPRLRCVSGELKSTEDFFFDPSLTTSTAQHTPLQYAKKGRTVVRFVLVQSFPHLFFFFLLFYRTLRLRFFGICRSSKLTAPVIFFSVCVFGFAALIFKTSPRDCNRSLFFSPLA